MFHISGRIPGTKGEVARQACRDEIVYSDVDELPFLLQSPKYISAAKARTLVFSF